MFTKILFVSLTLSFIQFANAADQCPNLSGKFQSESDLGLSQYMEFSQKNCELLAVRMCFPQAGHSSCVDPKKWSLVWQLNGKINGPCYPQSSCQIYTFDAKSIIVTETESNFRFKTAEHGFCTYQEFRWSLDSAKNLVETTKATNCTDGFSGEIESIRKRIK